MMSATARDARMFANWAFLPSSDWVLVLRTMTGAEFPGIIFTIWKFGGFANNEGHYPNCISYSF